MASRPGAIQLVSGDILHAVGWGNRALFSEGGRIKIWSNGEYDIAAAGRTLRGAPFAALTADAAREDRLYVADGVNPLWYIINPPGTNSFLQKQITNKIASEGGQPYDVPVAEDVAVFSKRLWVSDNSNRAQHCGNDDPDSWDPLWAVEVQTGKKDRVRALADHGESLAIGTSGTLWTVTGDSQYNFKPNKLVNNQGPIAPGAMASNGSDLFFASATGLYKAGRVMALSADVLDPVFQTPDYSAQIAFSPDGNYLLLFVHGRLFVMNVHTNKFGEIAVEARGIIVLDSGAGWYGADGIWILGAEDTPDIALDGTETDVVSTGTFWEEFPNPRGRAVCDRCYFTVKGSDRGQARHTVTARDEDYEETHSETFSLADEALSQFDAWDGSARIWPTTPVSRETAPGLAGRSFAHTISAPCHIELQHFEPHYRFGGKQ